MAYLPELHYCCICKADLGAENGDGICSECEDRMIECPGCGDLSMPGECGSCNAYEKHVRDQGDGSMNKHKDILFTGTWPKDAEDQLSAAYARGIEDAAKVCDERAMMLARQASDKRRGSATIEALLEWSLEVEDCAAAIRALAAQHTGGSE